MVSRLPSDRGFHPQSGGYSPGPTAAGWYELLPNCTRLTVDCFLLSSLAFDRARVLGSTEGPAGFSLEEEVGWLFRSMIPSVSPVWRVMWSRQMALRYEVAGDAVSAVQVFAYHMGSTLTSPTQQKAHSSSPQNAHDMRHKS